MTGFLIGAALFLLAAVLFRNRWKPGKNSAIPPDRPELPYRVYTREFDVECRGTDLARLFKNSGRRVDFAKSFLIEDDGKRERDFEASYRAVQSQLGSVADGNWSEWAVIVLIDQSGSLADRMACVAGQACGFAERLEKSGATTMVAGFTTFGWHGGKSRERWLAEGKASYPGRLCDLLHIVYSPFDTDISKEDLRPIFGAGAMYENIDGEALRWARAKLDARPEGKKAILVVSDGVPVDDSTIRENGRLYLDRDLRAAIAEIEADNGIALGAVGIDFEIAGYYGEASVRVQPEGIAGGMMNLLQSFADDRLTEFR